MKKVRMNRQVTYIKFLFAATIVLLNLGFIVILQKWGMKNIFSGAIILVNFGIAVLFTEHLFQNIRIKKEISSIKQILDNVLKDKNVNFSNFYSSKFTPLIETFEMIAQTYISSISNLSRFNQELTEILQKKNNKLNDVLQDKKQVDKFLRKLIIAIENLPIPFTMLDSKGTVIYYNHIDLLFPKIFNSKDNNDITILNLLKNNGFKYNANLKNLLQEQQTLDTLLVQKVKNGRNRYWRFLLIPYLESNEEEDEQFFVCIFMDISTEIYRKKINEHMHKLALLSKTSVGEFEIIALFDSFLKNELHISDYYVIKDESGHLEVEKLFIKNRKQEQWHLELVKQHYVELLKEGEWWVQSEQMQVIDENQTIQKKEDYYLFILKTIEEKNMIILIKSKRSQIEGFTEDIKLMFNELFIILKLYNEHQKLIQSEKQMRILFEEAQNAIIEYNEEGRIFNVNKSAIDLLGFDKKSDLINKNFFSFFESERDITFYQHMISAIGFIKDYDLPLKNAKGSRIHISLSTIPIKNGKEEIIGYRSTLYDITAKIMIENALVTKNKELKEINKKLKETQAQLIHQEKLASIGQLAAGIAHEINNPLGFVYSNFGTLKKYVQKIIDYLNELEMKMKESGDDTFINLNQSLMKKYKIDFIKEDLPALFEDSENGFERITQIVQNMRSFARVDNLEEREEYDLNQGIKSTLIVARNVYKYVADVELELGAIPTIKALGNEINQVLLNIVTNAVQAIKSQNRSEKGKISIKTYEDDEYVICEITDDGPGIPEKNLSKIFDPFFTTKPIGEGTGLGLHISYDIIVNKHKGQINVNSEVGKGTTFIIKLPKHKNSKIEQ